VPDFKGCRAPPAIAKFRPSHYVRARFPPTPGVVAVYKVGPAPERKEIPLKKSKGAKVPAASDAASRDSERKKKEKESEDKTFESFLSEVETELRDEALSNFWKKYSAHVVGVAALTVAGVFGYQLYGGYVEERREQMAMTYADATDAVDTGDFDVALDKLSQVENVSGEGYSAVAQLARASLLVDRDDKAGAVEIYTALANDGGVDPVFRDLATVLMAMHSMDDADPAQLESELAPLTGLGQPFRHSALEMAALLAAKQNAFDRAQRYLADILNDPASPPGIMSRAQDLSELYRAGGTPVPAEESAVEDTAEPEPS